MKKTVILFLLSLTLVQAGEIERVETIVDEISMLRSENNTLKNQIKDLNTQIEVLKKKKIPKRAKKLVCLKNQRIKDENPFPKLEMKKKYASVAKREYFKASAFRMNGNVAVYDGADGSKLATWEDKTSFTSNQRVGKWIKITGYFVDKVWRPADRELWVKSCDVLKRSKIEK